MKLKDRKINETFKTHSGVELQRLATAKNEIKLHKNYPIKCKRIDDGKIFFLEDNFLTISK